MTESALPAKFRQLNATQMTEDAKRILVRVIRVAFPHGSIPDAPYERTAQTILDEAEASTWWRVALTQGLNALNVVSGGDFTALSDEEALKVLRKVEDSTFFGFVRRTTVLNFYDDHEVWECLGYEGPSFDKGGYIDRGFNDLDWLPEPRIEEYDGPEEFVPYTPGLFAGPAPAVEAQRDTVTQPGTTEVQAGEVKK
jgi:hypothetical protein